MEDVVRSIASLLHISICKRFFAIEYTGMLQRHGLEHNHDALGPEIPPSQVYRHGLSCSNFIGGCTSCPELTAMVNDSLMTGISLTRQAGKTGMCSFGVVENPLPVNTFLRRCFSLLVMRSWDAHRYDDLYADTPATDVVMTSTLMRAIETGLYRFPNKTIYVVPFVKELSSSPSDTPTSVADQKKVRPCVCVCVMIGYSQVDAMVFTR